MKLEDIEKLIDEINTSYLEDGDIDRMLIQCRKCLPKLLRVVMAAKLSTNPSTKHRTHDHRPGCPKCDADIELYAALQDLDK
jgi:hypothetical protein